MYFVVTVEPVCECVCDCFVSFVTTQTDGCMGGGIEGHTQADRRTRENGGEWNRPSGAVKVRYAAIHKENHFEKKHRHTMQQQNFKRSDRRYSFFIASQPRNLNDHQF